ncbi:MAG: metallophosphoesterase [Thermoanaerobaculia bacterium]
MRISRSGSWKGLPLCCLILLAGCATSQAPRTVTAAAAPRMTVDKLVASELGPDDAFLIGAGDIADCDQLQPAKDTAAIIQKFPTATVFAAGDDAYTNGTDNEFKNCYGQSWGAFKERTRPSPGNHDYGIYPPVRRFNADPYFNYFGTNAGTAGLGYYSYDLGGWHIVSLNSMADQRGAPKMADQVAWLKDDLDHTEKKCILAYWHHPLFSSGSEHGDQANDPGRSMGTLWDVLLQHKADVILNGHDHHYERFALQDAAHKATPDGIREIIVGTGGGEDRGLGTIKVNSQLQLAHHYGVLLMTLHPNSYEWHFINVNGNVEDLGSGECH